MRFRKRQEAPAVFATFLYPYKGAMPLFGALPLEVSGNSSWGERFTTPSEEMEVALTKNGKTEQMSIGSALLGKVDLEAAGWVVRRSLATGDVEAGGWGIASYSGPNLEFRVETPATLPLNIHAHGTATEMTYKNAGDKPVVVDFKRPTARKITLPVAAAQ